MVTRLYTTRTQNWTLYSLQSHCRIEYPDGVVFEENCVEYCCPASSWGENLGSALEGLVHGISNAVFRVVATGSFFSFPPDLFV